MTTQEARRLLELEEVVGDLNSFENTEIGLVAVIGKNSLLLPEKLAGKLRGMVGCRIGILRLDGYHLRGFDKHAEGNRPATSGHEPDGSVMAVHFWKALASENPARGGLACALYPASTLVCGR